MINNKTLITPLLNFEKEGDFYMLYIMKRKKDQPEEERDSHQSVRTIKTYCVNSIEYLEKKYDEITQLCEMFKARAYIHVQKQNHMDVGLEMISQIAQRLKSGQINQKHIFDSVVGKIKTHEKRWVVDVDDVEFVSPVMLSHIEYVCKPITIPKYDEVGIVNGYESGPKIEEIIPTKNGYHLITKRFDVLEFKKEYPDTDIQKKNPTLLYYPSSLG